jgi:hypothetical protein
MTGDNKWTTHLNHLPSMDLECDHHSGSDDRVVTGKSFVKAL